MQKNSFELSVAVPSHGGFTKIKEYGLDGRTFIEGREGKPFSILFKNNTPQRVLAVPSVDGISALDGNPATEQSRGYIVAGYSSIEIKGWRTSLENVAQFVFEKKSGSYAAKGEVANDSSCGVIAVKVFDEFRRPPVKTVVQQHHHHQEDQS